MGLSEKSGSPFCVLIKVEGIAKNRVGGAKTVPKIKTPANDRNGVYLPTKKIGKNNPKAEQIKTDNQYRVMWNQTVDRALISGVPEGQILEVKQRKSY